MAHPERMPMEDLFSAQESLIERQVRHLDHARQLDAELKELDEAYRREMVELIGKTKVRNAQPKHEELLKRLEASAALFDLSPAGLKAEEAYKAQIVEERHELYRSLGFDHKKAIQLRQGFLDRKTAVFEKHLGLGREPEFASRSPKNLPITDNPWSHFSAPFVDEWGTSGSGTTRGSASASHSENRASGAINCWSYTRAVGADDSDHGWTRAMSEVWVSFRMPAAGMVEIWASLQDVDTNMDGRLRDESGCSDGSVRQTCRAYLWTSGGGVERYQTIRDYQVNSDGENKTWNIPLSAPGGFFYPHIFSSRSYVSGQWVTVAVGIQDDSSFSVNDMSVNPSRITSRYFVKDIWVRSTGAP